MVRYCCYDSYGQLVTEIMHETLNFKTVIIEYEGKYFRPVCYDLSDGNIAKCVPVEVIRVTSEKETA